MTKRKKIIWLLVCLAILAVAFLAWWLINKKKFDTTVPMVAGVESNNIDANAVLLADSDKDGLKDWEETLWKTDPSNPDSDSDSTSDGEEIKSGRDPLKKGPNDKLSQEDIQKKVVATTTEEDLTETDKFAREFFATYLSSQQSGEPIDQADYEKLLQEYLAEAQNKSDVRFYGASDFTVSTNETRDSIKRYGNDLANIFLKKQGEMNLENEVVIIDRYTKNNDPKELEKLKPLEEKYQKIETGLSEMNVPRSALILHIELINAISATKEGILAMQAVVTDPLRAIAGLNSYPDASGNIVPALRLVKKYLLDEKGVVFAQGDDGYVLFNAL